MNPSDTTLILNWIRQYFVICAATYLAAAAAGLWLMVRLRSGTTSVILLLSLGVYGVSLPYHWPFTNDDAFIFFRYANHLAQGLGFAYNPGQLTEGFTSPLWLAILTGAAKLHLPLDAYAKAVAAGCGAVSIVLMVLAANRFVDDRRVAFAVGFFVVTFQIFLAWIPSGMDVALFVGWIAWWTWEVTATRHFLWRLILLSAIGVWIRPEAYFFLATWWGLWWYGQEKRSYSFRTLATLGAVAVSAALPFLWRDLTFDAWLPLTFFAKSDRTIRSGVGFLFGAIHGYGPVIWTVSLAGLWQIRRRQPWLLGATILLAAYTVYIGGDVLIQRFSLWWLPLVVIGLAAGCTSLIRKVGRLSGALLLLVLVLFAGRELHRMYSITRGMSENDGYVYVSANAIHTAESDIPAGLYLREHADRGDTCLTDNIGAVGYFSELVIRDVSGLVDHEFAGLIRARLSREIPARVLSVRPEWIVCYEPPGSPPGTYKLSNIDPFPPELVAAYRRVMSWPSRNGHARALLHRVD